MLKLSNSRILKGTQLLNLCSIDNDLEFYRIMKFFKNICSPPYFVQFFEGSG